jgi:N-acetylmuramic acid 6-phosphate etherase
MARNTEERNPVSVGIDEKPVEEILRIINAEDQRVPAAVAGQIPRIAAAVEAVAATVSGGGRVFFVGAGTSGRLGVIEAAEMPPTFGVSPKLVQAVIAGGPDAVFHSVEEAEDDESASFRMLEQRGFNEKDILIALSASGRTPFIIDALKGAKKVGARTVVIACDPEAPVKELADDSIIVDVGPEVVAGSTRMKAGTAQKLVLNMLTTAAMIKLGKVYDGYMIEVQSTSRKLRERSIRIVEAVANVGHKSAVEALDSAQGDVKIAIIHARMGSSPEESKRILDRAGGSLRRALQNEGDSSDT